MAARNVLRPLAFRLRAGAEGIVLLKPQFELPKPDVRGGDVSDPQLRSKAFARFAARAETLGFAVIEQRDSAVSGGSGTIEIFLHLRFGGRPESLPQPGEQRRERGERAPRARAEPKPRAAKRHADLVRGRRARARALLCSPSSARFAGPRAPRASCRAASSSRAALRRRPMP